VPTGSRSQEAAGAVRYASPAGRWVLLAVVLGSGMAMLDGTVVNIALPTIGRELHEQFTGLQWTVNAYTLTLAGFLLLGGSLGDRLGRRRVFVVGVAWFAIASALCGAAPTAGTLIAARALQGVGAALLVPGSLAIIEATFRQQDRAPAVGAWSGLGGVATAIGPLLGGWLVGFSWRYVFFINLPLAAVVIWVALRHVPESRDSSVTGRLDVAGPALAAVGLAGLTWALTEGPAQGWTAAGVLVPGIAGVAALGGLLAVERFAAQPMLPLPIFGSRQFSAANVVTFVIYAALSGGLFLLPIQLQRVLGFSPLAAGAALVPLTIVMLLLSARAGRLAQRTGPRLPMTLGPLVAAAGLALLARIGPGTTYLADVLPAVLVFALGLALTVAPLTSTVLAAAGQEHAGVASAINNEVARVGGLLAVAVLPAVAGISGAAVLTRSAFSAGFRTATLIAAGLCAAGGLLSLLLIRRTPATEALPDDAALCCPIGAPPLRHPADRPAG
jgi:EmrB/QacA subfamily drug resistance transporter